MREIKYVLQTAIMLICFAILMLVLLKSYQLLIQGYRVLGNMIEHPSIEIVDTEDREPDKE